MKTIVYISFVLFFQLNILAQKKIVGIVEYYRTSPTESSITMSTSKQAINSLNSRIHKIKIHQNGIVNEFKTNKYGVLNAVIYDVDTIEITVNESSKLLKKRFIYKTNQLKDTLFLKIPDSKIANYTDSISAPKFYKKYSEKQAHIDFKNGKKRILAIGGFTTDESIKRRKELSEKYGITYENLLGCIALEPELRIIYRYNQTMKNLIGIEDVW